MSDEGLSKRERQKQRRAEKQQRQEQAARASRARRLGVLGLVVLVVGAGAGLLVWNQVSQRRAAADRAASAQARLAELGCTPIEQEQDFGGGNHIAGSALAGNPPTSLYARLPASAGPHLGQVTASGVFDQTVDERLVVHNLEHGYVTLWWDPDADQATIDAVRDFVDANLDEYPKLIAAPYNTDLPDDQAVTIVGWTYRQQCEQFDPEVVQVFLDEHYGLAGDAPEKSLAPHDDGGQGVIVPEDGEALLFPPLDGSADPAELPSRPAPSTSVDAQGG